MRKTMRTERWGQLGWTRHRSLLLPGRAVFWGSTDSQPEVYARANGMSTGALRFHRPRLEDGDLTLEVGVGVRSHYLVVSRRPTRRTAPATVHAS